MAFLNTILFSNWVYIVIASIFDVRFLMSKLSLKLIIVLTFTLLTICSFYCPKRQLSLPDSSNSDFNPAEQPLPFHLPTVNLPLAPPHPPIYPTFPQDLSEPPLPTRSCLHILIFLPSTLALATLTSLLLFLPASASGAEGIVQVHVPFSMPDLYHIVSKLGSFSWPIPPGSLSNLNISSFLIIYPWETSMLFSPPVPPQKKRTEFYPRLLNMLMIWTSISLHNMLPARQWFP